MGLTLNSAVPFLHTRIRNYGKKIKFLRVIITKECNKIMKEKRNAEYLAMLDKSMAEAKAGGFTLEKDVGKIK